jgi:predicted PurR-regulated permease PerM
MTATSRIQHDRRAVSGAFPRPRVPSRPALVAIAGVAILFVAAQLAAGALAVFVVGAVLAIILDPVVTAIARRGVHRALATALVILVLTGLMSLAGLILVLKVITEAVAFLDRVPGWIRDAVDSYQAAPLPPSLRDVADAVIRDAREAITLGDLITGGLGMAGQTVGSVAVMLGVLPFFLFFVLADRPRTVERAIASIPAQWRGDLVAIGEIVLRSFATYLRGEVVLAALLTVITWGGLHLLASTVDARIGEFASLLTLLAGFSELIPLFGPWIAGIPAVAVALSISPEAALATAAVYLVIAVVEGQILVPVVHGRQFSIHPIVVGLGVIVGHSVGGALGAILALPVLAAGLESYRYVFGRATRELSAPVVHVAPEGGLVTWHTETIREAPARSLRAG